MHTTGFIIALGMGSVAAFAFTLFSLRKGRGIGGILKTVSWLVLFCMPLTGMIAGSFHSHGFDIPWWAFAVVGGLGVLGASLIAWAANSLLGRSDSLL